MLHGDTLSPEFCSGSGVHHETDCKMSPAWVSDGWCEGYQMTAAHIAGLDYSDDMQSNAQHLLTALKTKTKTLGLKINIWVHAGRWLS